MRPAIVAWFEGRIGTGFFVPTYDLLLGAAVVAAFYIAGRDADRRGLDGDNVFRAGVVMALVGFAGARLYVVFQDFPTYVDQPLAVLRVWEGGTASTGMYLGVLLAGVGAAHWQRLPTLKLLDTAAPSAAAGIVFGRIACFLNGCCFGGISDLPWAMRFPVGSGPQVAHVNLGLVSPGQASEPVHPVQLYEVAVAALLFGFLWRLRRTERRDGASAAFFLLLYGTSRFGTEFLRGDARAHIAALSVPQVFWLIAAVSAAAFLLHGRLRRTPAA